METGCRDLRTVVVGMTWSRYSPNSQYIQVYSLEELQCSLVDTSKWRHHYDFCTQHSFRMEMGCKDRLFLPVAEVLVVVEV